MEKKTGVLEKAKRKFGIFRDLELVVSGEKFFRRIHCGKISKDIRNYVGKKVEVDYEKTITSATDWLCDRILFGCFGIPRHYNQIKSIEIVN